MFNPKKLGKNLVYKMVNKEKIKAQKQKRKLEKSKKRKARIKAFGKGKYYLSILFGKWILYL